MSSPLTSGRPKSAVFGSSLSLPQLISEGGERVCESVGKTDLLSDHFDSMQSSEAVDLPITCHPSPSLTTFAVRSREVRRLLLDLGPYGCTDPLGMFHFFLKRTADVMAPLLCVVFRRLVCLGSFPAAFRQANVTPIPKGPLSFFVVNYRPISITSVLSNVFERLVSVHLRRFMACSSWTIYGTQWCDSNHPVCLSERSGYLRCTFVRVPFTAMCNGKWA